MNCAVDKFGNFYKVGKGDKIGKYNTVVTVSLYCGVDKFDRVDSDCIVQCIMELTELTRLCCIVELTEAKNTIVQLTYLTMTVLCSVLWS